MSQLPRYCVAANQSVITYTLLYCHLVKDWENLKQRKIKVVVKYTAFERGLFLFGIRISESLFQNISVIVSVNFQFYKNFIVRKNVLQTKLLRD